MDATHGVWRCRTGRDRRNTVQPKRGRVSRCPLSRWSMRRRALSDAYLVWNPATWCGLPVLCFLFRQSSLWLDPAACVPCLGWDGLRVATTWGLFADNVRLIAGVRLIVSTAFAFVCWIYGHAFQAENEAAQVSKSPVSDLSSR